MKLKNKLKIAGLTLMAAVSLYSVKDAPSIDNTAARVPASTTISLKNDEAKYQINNIYVMITQTITGEDEIFLVDNLYRQLYIGGYKGYANEIFTDSKYIYDGNSDFYPLSEFLTLEEAKEYLSYQEILAIYNRIRTNFNNHNETERENKFGEFSFQANVDEPEYYANRIFFCKMTTTDDQEKLSLAILSPAFGVFKHQVNYKDNETYSHVTDIFTIAQLTNGNVQEYTLSPISDLIPVSALKPSYTESELKQILAYARSIMQIDESFEIPNKLTLERNNN